MDAPVQMQLKPERVTGMQYTGDNVEKFVEWMRTCDPRIHSYSIEREFGPMNFMVHADGGTKIRVTEHLVVSSSTGAIFHIYKGQWVFQNKNGQLSLHNETSVKSQWEIVS